MAHIQFSVQSLSCSSIYCERCCEQVQEYVRDVVEASVDTARRTVDAREMAAMPRSACKVTILVITTTQFIVHDLSDNKSVGHSSNLVYTMPRSACKVTTVVISHPILCSAPLTKSL